MTSMIASNGNPINAILIHKRLLPYAVRETADPRHA